MGRVSFWFRKLHRRVLAKFERSPAKPEIVLPVLVTDHTQQGCHNSPEHDILKRRRSLDDVDDVDYRHKKKRTVPKHSITKVPKLRREVIPRKPDKSTVSSTPARVADRLEDSYALSDTEMLDYSPEPALVAHRPENYHVSSRKDILNLNQLLNHRRKKVRAIPKHSMAKVSKKRHRPAR
jgi:hypothetical protein